MQNTYQCERSIWRRQFILFERHVKRVLTIVFNVPKQKSSDTIVQFNPEFNTDMNEYINYYCNEYLAFEWHITLRRLPSCLVNFVTCCHA